jgi:hypothetical protein
MRQTETIVWAGGEHQFYLGIGQLRAIEQRCDAGCAVVLMRLMGSQWKIDDVVSTLRLGLVGAGMKESEAQKVVESALDVASPFELAVTSAELLRRFLIWDKDDQPGESPAGRATKNRSPRSPTESSDGPDTSATVQ